MSSHKKKNKTSKKRSIDSSLLRPHIQTIKLTNVLMDGFAAANALSGERVPIIVRATLTSDKRDFHIYAEGIISLLIARAKDVGVTISVDSLISFILVVHNDKTADLHLNNIQIALEILAKRDIEAGEAVYLRDIGDIRKVKFPDITFLPSDKVFICFKVGWKFGMFFDLEDNRELDIDKMESDLGVLYKQLRYQGVYEALAEQTTVNRMTEAGWFPFIEIIGGDVDPLLKAYQSEFDIEDKEKQLVEKFTSDRIEKIAERWWKNKIILKHEIVLCAGLKAFKRQDYVSCIKNIITEIEGILSDLHFAEKGSHTKYEKSVPFAVDKGVRKSGGVGSLFFPKDFQEYLLKQIYANFDPGTSDSAGASRHTVGHGYADGKSYTRTRALQVILTFDQIVFYI